MISSQNVNVEEKILHVPYKYCVVPKCISTTKRTPNKIFFQVPKDPKTRKKWCEIMRRHPLKSAVTSRHCCEDHFELQDDMSNYWHYKLMKAAPRLKPGVIPHKFMCQRSSPLPPEETLIGKRRKQVLVQQAEETLQWGYFSEPQPSTSHSPETME